jgi:hypothetical protein
MAGFLLLYERSEAAPGSWQPLLLQQAIVAVTRAILTHGSSEIPAMSDDAIFAPLNLDILPLLAMQASDFADFAEPEGRVRPRAPIRLYEDGSWKDDLDGEDELRHLLHPAWFERLPMDLEGTIREYRPKNCIILGDPAKAADRAGDLLSYFTRIMHFEHLVTGDSRAELKWPIEPVAVDSLLERTIKSRIAEGDPASRISMWDRMLAEGTAPDLEPFVAFGPALEMVALTDEDDRDDDDRSDPRER